MEWVCFGGMLFIVLATVLAYFNTLKRDQNAKKLADAILKLDAAPSDRDAQLNFLRTTTGSALPVNEIRTEFQRSFDILKSNLGDREIQQAFANYLVRVEWVGIGREDGYRLILGVLAVNSEPAVKQFVLDVARWHYALTRKNGKLTVYDE
jgi:hypothetical protein